MNALNGHESVGIMPQGVAACAVPELLERLFFTDGRPIGPINRAIGAPNW